MEPKNNLQQNSQKKNYIRNIICHIPRMFLMLRVTMVVTCRIPLNPIYPGMTVTRQLAQYGSSGGDVEHLQGLLNKIVVKGFLKGSVSPLKTDGKFGSKTLDLVDAFQKHANLDADGKVGKCTWSALEGTEKYNRFDFSNWVKQPNDSECWAAAVAMLKGRSTPIRKRYDTSTPPVDYSIDGGLENSHTNMRRFARYSRLQFAMYVKCKTLCDMVAARGRVMINVRGMHGNMTNANVNNSHLMCIMGLRGSGEPGGTTLTIYNPWGKGDTRRKVTRSFRYLSNRYPGLMYQCLYR